MELYDLKFATNKDLHQELANELVSEFNSCVSYRNSISVLGTPLGTEIDLAEAQLNGAFVSQADKEIAERLGVGLQVNLSENKISSTHALLREMYGDSGQDPILLTPSPIPDIPETSTTSLINEIKKDVLAGKYQISGAEAEQVILREIKAKKEQELQRLNEVATASAKQHQLLIADQLMEGGYHNEIINMWYNLLVYPFACMLGPVPTLGYKNIWAAGKIVPELQLIYKIVNIHPKHVYWTPDCTNTQDGTAFFIRRKLSYSDLCNIISYKKSGYTGYIKDAIKDIITTVSDDLGQNKKTYFQEWSSTDAFSTMEPFTRGTSIDTITRYGKLFGSELRRIGVKDKRINNVELYDTVVTVIKDRIIYASYELQHGKHRRPIHITAWQKNNNPMVGVSVAKKIRDVERAYHATHRGLLHNMFNSIAPTGEISIDRVSQYLQETNTTLEEVAVFEAGRMLPVSPNLSGAGTPAVYFHNIPNVASQLISVMQMYKQEIDNISQIPAILQGQAMQNSGVRTFRQQTQLEGNALKVAQAAMANVEKDIIRPIGQLLYEFNVNNPRYDYIQGDCNVRTSYTADLLLKEMKKQQALETIQVLGQLSQANVLDPRMMQDTSTQLLEAVGIDLSKYEAVTKPVPAQDVVPQTSNNIG